MGSRGTVTDNIKAPWAALCEVFINTSDTVADTVRCPACAGAASPRCAPAASRRKQSVSPLAQQSVPHRPDHHRLLTVPGVPGHLELPGPLQHEPQAVPHQQPRYRQMPITGGVDTPLMPSVSWAKFWTGISTWPVCLRWPSPLEAEPTAPDGGTYLIPAAICRNPI